MGTITKISIEKASKNDLKQLLIIMDELSSELPRNLFVPSTKKEIKNGVSNKNSFILIAKKDGVLCGGCVIIKPNNKNHYFDLAPSSECIIFDSIFLNSMSRGFNIASLLVLKALEIIKTEYKNSKYVYCSINNNNAKSLKLMTNAGFSYYSTKKLYGGLDRDIFFMKF